MFITRHRPVRIALRVFAVGLFVLLAGNSVVAQEPRPTRPMPPGQDGQPGEPVVPEGPKPMAFQPASSARGIADFVPPQTRMIETNVVAQEVATFGHEAMTTHRAEFQTKRIALNVQRDNAVRLADDKLSVVVEQDTFAQPVGLEVRSLAVANKTATPRLNNEAVQTRFELGENPTLMHFELEMVDGQNRPLTSFDKEVRLVVDLREYGIDLDEQGGTFFLAYEDENEPGVWHEVDITTYDNTGLISAETDHFSGWEAGWRPDFWTLQWEPPTPDAFTGAATYSYPFQLPPGRAGLGPTLGLSYSSSALRGAGNRGTTFGSVATGWSLNDAKITRTGSKMNDNGTGYDYPNTFRLTLNGKGGRLIAGPSENGGTLHYVEDMPQLRVYSFNDADNSYWIVQTGDGTSYRFGYTANSETTHSIKGPASGDTTYSDARTISWHLDTVTDVYGNQITYSYVNHERITNTNPLWLKVKTQNKDLAEIEYNFNDRIADSELNQSFPALGTLSRLSDSATAATRIEIVYDGEKLLEAVKVFHGDVETKRYLIDAQTNMIDNLVVGGSSCAGLDSDGHWGGETYTRIINSITEQGFDQNGEIVSLPATTFEHQKLRHFQWGTTACIFYEYLAAVNNGYGGRVEYQYVPDGRSVSSGVNGSWVMRSAEQFVVSKVIQNDGINDPVTIEYSYADRCYDQRYNPCTQPESEGTEYGLIGGHGTVTVTTRGFDNEVLQSTVTRFHTELDKLGRPWQTETKNSLGTTLQKTETSYIVDSFGTTSNVRFTYTNVVTSTQYAHNGGPETIATKTEYSYSTLDQGGTQYGNVTLVEEYDDANATEPFRSTRTRFEPNAGDWLVNLVANQAIYSGTVISTNLQTATWTYYDGNADWEMQPSRGSVTYARIVEPLDCGEAANEFLPPSGTFAGCMYARRTIDSSFGHDTYGNVITATNFSDYGFKIFDSSWENSRNECFPLKKVIRPQSATTATTTYILLAP